MSEETKKPDFQRTIQLALFGVAGIAIAGAVLHAIYPENVDQTTAVFLGIAIVTLLGHQITKFKGFGLEIERDIQKIKEDVNDVEKAFVGLAKDVGPGSKSAVPPSSAGAEMLTDTKSLPFNPEDPNKGRFGGSPVNNGRKLSATIRPTAGPKSSGCNVTIIVTSIDPHLPLTGKVKFHLHPTFGQWSSYDVEAKGGVAEDTISSYGAFTIGAEADGGATRLELDLVDVPGGTKSFYMS